MTLTTPCSSAFVKYFIFFHSVCVKGIPKINDHVVADAVYSPNPQYKWKASRVQILNSDRDFSNVKPLMGSRSQNGEKSKMHDGLLIPIMKHMFCVDFDSRKRGRSPIHREKSRDRRYDDGDRKRFKRDDKDDKSKLVWTSFPSALQKNANFLKLKIL